MIGGSWDRTVCRQCWRQLSQRSSRNEQWTVQGRGHTSAWAMARLRCRRIRHLGMGSLVKQPQTAGTHREYPASRSRGKLLRSYGNFRHGRVTKTNQPPANPARFRPCWSLSQLRVLFNIPVQVSEILGPGKKLALKTEIDAPTNGPKPTLGALTNAAFAARKAAIGLCFLGNLPSRAVNLVRSTKPTQWAASDLPAAMRRMTCIACSAKGECLSVGQAIAVVTIEISSNKGTILTFSGANRLMDCGTSAAP